MPDPGPSLTEKLSLSIVPIVHLDRLLSNLPKSFPSPYSLNPNPPSNTTSASFEVDAHASDQYLLSILEFVEVQSLHSFFFYRLFQQYLTAEFTPTLSQLFCFALQQALQSPTWFASIPKCFQHFKSPSSFQSLYLQDFLSKFDLSQIELFLIALSFISTPDPSIQSQAENLLQRHQSVFYLHIRSNPIPSFLKERFDQYSNSARLSSDMPSASNSREASLAGILRVIGYPALATAESFRRIITKLANGSAKSSFCSDKAVAQCVILMCMHPSDYAPPDHIPAPWSQIINETAGTKTFTKWNLDAFLSGVHEANPNLNWVSVIEHLDQESFQLQNLKGLELIIEVYKKANKHKKFPIQALFTQWKHPYAQYSLLAQIVSASPNLLNFADYTANETRKVVPPEDLAIASSASTSTSIVTLPNHALNCLEVWATFIQLLKCPECTAPVKEFLENASNKAPELFLLGLVQLPEPWDPLHQTKVNELIQEFLLGKKPNSSFVLPRLLDLSPDLLFNTMLALYESDPNLLPSFAEFLIEANGGLEMCLESFPDDLALDVAALASRRNYPNLDAWLQKRYENQGGESWLNACMDFIKSHANNPSDGHMLSPSFASQIIKFIEARSMPPLPKDLQEAMASLSLKLDAAFHRDIEDQAIRLFDLFYTGEMSLDNFISQLISLKESPDQMSQDIFDCTIMTFIDETKFFHTYPECNLIIAAMFMGQLLFHRLLTTTLTQAALKFLLEALGQTEPNKLFHFGFTAIGQFLNRISDFPEFAEKVIQLPVFIETAPEVVQLIRQKFSSKPFNSLYPDPDLVETLINVDTPPDATQDKLLFVINNLSPSNVEAKCKEIGEVLVQEYFRWFSHYLVTKRAPLEPNFHTLYLQFLQHIGSELMWNCMLFETLTLIEVLLNSEKTVESSTERTKLKHLGSWLGGLTLARDKPLLHRHLAVKQLLMEGFQQGRLMIVVPFVCKVLEQCKFSTVFLPPNPWLMATLAFLVELYQFAELKLNLKFEIEVLCKNLAIELNEIRPTSLLQKLNSLQLSLAGFPSTSTAEAVTNAAAAIKSMDQLITGMSNLPTQSGHAQPAAPSAAPASSSSSSSSTSSSSASSSTPSSVLHLLPGASQHPPLPPNLGHVAGTTILPLPSSTQPSEVSLSTASAPGAPALPNFRTVATVSTGSAVNSAPASASSAHVPTGTSSAPHSHLPPFLQVPQSTAPSISSAPGPAPLPASSYSGVPSSQDVLTPFGPNFSIPSLPRLATNLANATFANLSSYILVNPNVSAMASQPSFKRVVCLAIDRTIREILTPVVERAVTIAGISTKELVMKDFAFEPDDLKLRKAAHMMAQSLAGSLAMVTCKEPLRVSMLAHLRTLLMQNGVSEHDLPDAVLIIIVNDNIELSSHLIQKAAMEKAIPDIEEHLAPEFLKRKQARELGKSLLEIHPEYRHRLISLPDPLRVKPTGLTLHQLTAYEEYGRAPLPEESLQDILKLCIEKFTHYMTELEQQLTHCSFTKLSDIPTQHDIREIIRQIPLILPHNQSSEHLALLFCSKVLQPLYSTHSELGRDVYAVIIRELCSQSVTVSKEVVQWLLYSDDERKYNERATCSLIKSGLLNLNDVDVQLAKQMEAGKDIFNYGIGLIEICAKDGVAMECDWFNILDVLNRMMLSQRNPPERVKTFMGNFRGRLKSISTMSLDPLDPNGKEQVQLLNEQLAYTFAEWVRLYHHPNTNETMLQSFILELQKYPIFNNDDTFCLFFRICTQISVDAWLKSYKSTNSPALAYQGIDAFAKLIILLSKYHLKETSTPPSTTTVSPTTPALSTTPTVNHSEVKNKTTINTAPGTSIALSQAQGKLALFSKIISIIVLVLVHNHETQKSRFNQKPYFRLFASILTELHASEHFSPQLCFSMLQVLSNTFHTLQPVFLPGFAFSWLSLIAHRQFLPKTLLMENQLGWPLFNKLLLDLFRFLVPFLRDAKLREPTRLLYKGTLRVLLVLLHDFPEFLCEYYCTLCSVIPPNCLQLRNLILSAFPRNMRLPDPFTPNLKMELLPDIHVAPAVHTEGFVQLLQTANITLYVWDAASVAAKFKFMNNKRDEVTSSIYNVHLINAVVFLAGMNDSDLQRLQFYRDLLAHLDNEGRYHVLSALVNHLRYPNAHTRYFASILLSLFRQKEADTSIQEQITRVLLERLIVNRPHPWGLLVTFIELIKDPQYGFWNYGFTRCAPDIERLFESVSRSVNQH